MSRPLRLEFAGALYHMTSRGDRREDIYWGLPSPLEKTRHQLVLGDDALAERHRQTQGAEALREVSKARRRSGGFLGG